MAAKTAAVHVLGCKVNQQEAEALEKLFADAGYHLVNFNQPADVYVVHTCTVTNLGSSKSRQMIRRAVRTNPEAVVAVTGCYAQVSPEEVCQIPGVDLIIGTQDRGRIVELVEQVAQDRVPLNLVQELKQGNPFEELPMVTGNRVRAFLKIQEGCRQFCTYCIVPYARGPLRSREPASAEKEAVLLVERGYQEIVLTGVHLGSYGVDLPGNPTLAGLIRNLSRINGLSRLRLSSLDPNEFDAELLEVLTKSEVICPHLHIPLQSGEDQVLKRMGRRYTTEDYRQLLDKLRLAFPGLAVTTDIIAGFPGETAAQFAQTLAFAEEMAFAGIHVFKFSPRAGTPAAKFPHQVHPREKEERSQALLQLAQRLWRQYAAGFVGQVKTVLVEQEKEASKGLWEGHTDNYLKVVFPGDGDLRGKLLPVTLKEIREEGYLTGALAGF
ncbi:MAG: tRNA (N(6)-L-threonylcarbamoyladenosine(37)-C(2))-methylthiotransferase MtaB [Bacillota bacterium]